MAKIYYIRVFFLTNALESDDERVSLAVDLAGWWLARGSAAWVTALVAGGALFALTNAFLAVLILLDLVLPDKE